MAQTAWTEEYNERISAEGYDPLNECPRYDLKQSDGEASVMLKLRGMWSTPSLPLLPGQLQSNST